MKKSGSSIVAEKISYNLACISLLFDKYWRICAQKSVQISSFHFFPPQFTLQLCAPSVSLGRKPSFVAEYIKKSNCSRENSEPCSFCFVSLWQILRILHACDQCHFRFCHIRFQSAKCVTEKSSFACKFVTVCRRVDSKTCTKRRDPYLLRCVSFKFVKWD